MSTIQSIGWRGAGAFSLGLLLLPVSSIPNSPEHESDSSLHRHPVVSMRHGDEPKPIPAFIERSLDWLAAAQFENGGWGAGSHSNQGVRDPHAVSIDPATTAFSAMALARAGSTLQEGAYREHLRRALDYLVEVVEQAPEDGPSITDIAGTQPQVKLGNNIDVSMVSQFLTRMLPQTSHEKRYHARVEAALNKCIRKIQLAQNADGSINNAGWAGVLQSAMANQALERAAGAGAKVDMDALERSRRYQQSNVSADGAVRTEAAAGVSLYSLASSQRAAAPVVRDARQRLDEAKKAGRITEEAELDEKTLKEIGYSDSEARSVNDTFRSYEKATELLSNDDVLAGFGNNGGEEFLSYMMTSEALAESGGAEWDQWYNRMNNRLEKIQNPNGSWSGHHCITSPVFSTAAVILTMTADRDSYHFAAK